MDVLLPLRYVAVGGAVGSLLRWGALGLVDDDKTTITVLGLNVVGSLLLGILAGRQQSRRKKRRRVTENQYLLAGTGFCGGLTTFSTFAVDVAQALDSGELVRAGSITLATMVTVVLSAGIGYRLGRRI